MDPETLTISVFVLAVATYVLYFLICKKKSMDEARLRNRFVVTEGHSATWHYHLSDRTNPFVSLCGKCVFPTRIPLDYFRSIVGKRRERLEDGHACPECSKFLD